MRVLVFDTETTGLPETKIINPDTLNLWPHVVQFSYIIYDASLNSIVEKSDSIVKLSNEIIISEDSSKIHGITNELSKKKGINIQRILNNFFYHLRTVDMLVGHNVSFDINMLKVELLRIIYNDKIRCSDRLLKKYKYNLHFIINYKNICCTLQESIELCNIKGVTKFGKEYLKFPKLLELHQKLFESEPNNLHNSFNDILVTLRCFMKLKFNIDLNDKCRDFKQTVKALQIF
jgi:DNA polymerase-3 subunit epsilon